MCTYVDYVKSYRRCTRTPKHTTTKREYNLCEPAKASGQPCRDVTADQNTVMGSSSVTTACPLCPQYVYIHLYMQLLTK
jgi:hypothetical protein